MLNCLSVVLILFSKHFFLTKQNIVIIYSWYITINSRKILFLSKENQLNYTEVIMKIIPLKYDFCVKEVMENETVWRHFISDVLGIPLRDIKSVRILNPFLWKRYKKQKLGILDIQLELNNDAKINIEIQLKQMHNWKKRSVFYLAKMFTAVLRRGEDYEKAKRDRYAEDKFIRVQAEKEGMEKGISAIVHSMRGINATDEQIINALMTEYGFSQEEAREKVH